MKSITYSFATGSSDRLTVEITWRDRGVTRIDGVRPNRLYQIRQPAAGPAQPSALGEPLSLVRREWSTDIGPVDLMCRDEDGAWVAVEIKRIGTLDAVEQLTRYLERIRPELDGCRGVLAAQAIKPQARTLAEARGIRCVEVDLAVLRGEREPELTLFAERA